MKKRKVVYCGALFMCFLFLISSIPSTFAYTYYEEDYAFTEDLTIGIRAGSLINSFDKHYPFGMPARGLTDIEIKGKDGWFFDITLDKQVNNYVAIGIETGHYTYDMDFAVTPVANSGVQGDLGSMDILPVVGRVRLQYPIEDYAEFSELKYRLAPYLSAGIGGMFTNFDPSGYATSSGYSFITDSSALAGKYGMGLDFYINENFAFNFEGSYMDMDVKTVLTNEGIANTEDMHQNSWLIGGGLKYSF